MSFFCINFSFLTTSTSRICTSLYLSSSMAFTSANSYTIVSFSLIERAALWRITTSEKRLASGLRSPFYRVNSSKALIETVDWSIDTLFIKSLKKSCMISSTDTVPSLSSSSSAWNTVSAKSELTASQKYSTPTWLLP